MEKNEPCETCRFNPQTQNDGAGGDCANCNDFSEWMEFKRVIIEKCETCFYEDDPCHYFCVECQDAKNWTPKPNLKEEILTEIHKREGEIEKFKKLLNEL